MASTAGFLGAERVLQGLRGVREQDYAAETEESHSIGNGT